MNKEKRRRGEEEICHIKDRIFNKGFSVNRMPQKKLELFMKTAKEEFCDDYGMTIAFFMDYFFMISPLQERINELEKRVSEFQANRPEEKSAGIKMLNGKVLGEK